LGVGEFDLGWIGWRLWVKCVELSECVGVAVANAAQEVFRLMFELVQVRTNGEKL
jgi:hypothetical protein